MTTYWAVDRALWVNINTFKMVLKNNTFVKTCYLLYFYFRK